MPSRRAAILVIEDNPANMKLVKVLLTSDGHDVCAAADAEEALEVLGSYHPRLILTDIQLPGMDGLELTRRLRADPSWDDTVIVALTAYAMKGDEDKALAAGCDGYITKPLDPDTFSAQITSALGQRPRTVASLEVKPGDIKAKVEPLPAQPVVKPKAAIKG